MTVTVLFCFLNPCSFSGVAAALPSMQTPRRSRCVHELWEVNCGDLGVQLSCGNSHRVLASLISHCVGWSWTFVHWDIILVAEMCTGLRESGPCRLGGQGFTEVPSHRRARFYVQKEDRHFSPLLLLIHINSQKVINPLPWLKWHYLVPDSWNTVSLQKDLAHTR